jgi:hypothetical protein
VLEPAAQTIQEFTLEIMAAGAGDRIKEVPACGSQG